MYLKPFAVWIRKHNILPNHLTYRTLVQLSRYVVTGTVAFTCEYIIFTIIYFLSSRNVVMSNSIAMFVGFTISFLLNRNWSFKSKRNLYRQILSIAVLLMANLQLSTIVINYMHGTFGLTPIISKLIMMIFIAFWNFILYKKFIYR